MGIWKGRPLILMSKCSGLYLELRLSPIRQPLIDLVPDLLILNEIAGRFDTRVDLAVQLASTNLHVGR